MSDEKYPPTKERLEQLLKKEKELNALKLERDLKPFVEEMKEYAFTTLKWCHRRRGRHFQLKRYRRLPPTFCSTT